MLHPLFFLHGKLTISVYLSNKKLTAVCSLGKAHSALFIYKFIVALFFLVCVQRNPSLADPAEQFAEVNRQLLNFGCDHDELRNEMSGSYVSQDYTTIFLFDGGGGVLRRYRWSQHETKIIGPDKGTDPTWRWYVLNTIVAGNALPRRFQDLNSPLAREFLSSAGFALGLPDSRYPGVEQFRRENWDDHRGFFTETVVVYNAGLVSTINWFCAGRP